MSSPDAHQRSITRELLLGLQFFMLPVTDLATEKADSTTLVENIVREIPAGK